MPSFAVPEGWPRKSKGRRQQKEATVSRYQMMCILVSVRSLSDLPQRFRSKEKLKGRIKGGRESAGFNSGLNQQLSDVKSARPQGLEGVPTCRTGLVPRWSEMDRYLSFPSFLGKSTPPRTLEKGPNAIKCYNDSGETYLEFSIIVSHDRPQLPPPTVIFPSFFVKHNLISSQNHMYTHTTSQR